MSQFILDTSGAVTTEGPDANTRPVTFDRLDPFIQGYIEAAFFTESSPAWDKAAIAARPSEWESDLQEGTSDGQLPGDSGYADLDPATFRRMIEDCAAFQRDNADALARAYDARIDGRGDDAGPGDYDSTLAGRDYWYTRNGHGVGFWDRGLGEVGDTLSDAARYSEVNAYYDPATGLVHFD